jgi:hypothetical protein
MLVSNWVNDWEVSSIDITDIAFNIATRGMMYDERIGRVYPDQSIPNLPDRQIEDPTAI